MPPIDLTVALYTAEQSRRIDRKAIDHCGIAGFELMNRAADAVFAALRRQWPDARRIAVFAGRGNNGGDALLVARRALESGLDVDAFVDDAKPEGDAATARKTFLDIGGKIRSLHDARHFADVDVIVDGLFGTGLSRTIEGETASLIERINASGVPVIAIDIPSGLSADTGMRLGPTIRASATVSLIAWKRGLFTGDAADCVGARELAPLDVPSAAFDAVEPDATLIGGASFRALAPREGNVSKGNYGHVLAIGGDTGMGGAIRLTSEAALRCGAGLVSVATRATHVAPLLAGRPELMPRAVEETKELDALLSRASVVAIGPGLGRDAWGVALWKRAIDTDKPLVVDADALNLLAEHPRDLADAVLTPHPGEAARLLGTDTKSVQADRFTAARELAKRYASVVVLKGAGSLVASPDGRVAVCPWGNPGMATAGMGDVLTGVVAAMRAQGLPAWDAACFAVGAHARAGDRAAGDTPRGLIASDLFAPLRELVNRFEP
jgi:ADP-dependent NAD(P)H-hydrate dehydratase / NAD(P)H-hydrate epimerase